MSPAPSRPSNLPSSAYLTLVPDRYAVGNLRATETTAIERKFKKHVHRPQKIDVLVSSSSNYASVTFFITASHILILLLLLIPIHFLCLIRGRRTQGKSHIQYL